ncbi:MAG: anti-sigma regulatory factor [Thermodesulfobacteriota bacterium]
MTTNNKAERQIEVLLTCDEDVILARQKIRTLSTEIGFGMLDQTRIVTAASELARNIIVHAGRGKVVAESLAPRPGVRVLFIDQGPGIRDLDTVMQEGYSSVGSLGMGLKGAKRLVDEFDIKTQAGAGTTITIVKWLPTD